MNYKTIIFNSTLISLIFILSGFMTNNNHNDVIIDSNLSFDEAIKGTNAPDSLLAHITLLNLQYYSVDGKLHQGQLLINKEIEQDVKEVFEVIMKTKYPINKMIPIVKYDWSDDKSMADNNSSAFNYRFIAGTKRLSNHSFGKAIDINPFFNPVIYNDGRISPKGAKYTPGTQKVFTKDHIIVKEFKKRGFRWGGDWNSLKDYHHFDKPNK